MYQRILYKNKNKIYKMYRHIQNYLKKSTCFRIQNECILIFGGKNQRLVRSSPMVKRQKKYLLWSVVVRTIILVFILYQINVGTE